MPENENDRNRRRLERYAWFLDSSIRIPGTDFRIGLDGLIGLIPGFGDTVGALASSYILAEAGRLGAPKSVLFKMVFNIVIDALVGAIPILGDLFDFAWKANRRNVDLLNEYLRKPGKTVRSSRLLIVGLSILMVVFVIFIAVLGALLVGWLWKEVAGS